jgi:hypothetical protein
MLACLLAIAVAVAALAACGGETAPPADSGVEGLVLIGPMCPVVQEGEPCPDEPFAATIVVRSGDDGKLVATLRSGDDGRFSVNLAPGEYVLVPLSPNEGAPPFASPVTVRVELHRFTQVTISYDSGIR